MASSVLWEIKNKNKNLPASSVFQKSGLRNTCLFFFSLNDLVLREVNAEIVKLSICELIAAIFFMKTLPILIGFSAFLMRMAPIMIGNGMF